MPQIAYVCWRDACHGREPSPDTEVELFELHEVGWLVGATKEAIKLALEREDLDDSVPGEGRLWLTIPRSCIVEMQAWEFTPDKRLKKKTRPSKRPARAR